MPNRYITRAEKNLQETRDRAVRSLEEAILSVSETEEEWHRRYLEKGLGFSTRGVEWKAAKKQSLIEAIDTQDAYTIALAEVEH